MGGEGDAGFPVAAARGKGRQHQKTVKAFLRLVLHVTRNIPMDGRACDPHASASTHKMLRTAVACSVVRLLLLRCASAIPLAVLRSKRSDLELLQVGTSSSTSGRFCLRSSLKVKLHP